MIGETEEPDYESVDVDDKIIEDHEEDEIHDILTDLHPVFTVDNMNTANDDVLEEEPNREAKRFYSLLKDFDQPLFEDTNCGIVVAGETDEEDKTIDYYGELKYILELQFIGGRRLVLFRCMWFDVYDNERGVKMDEYNIVSVNPQRFLKTDNPFVLANQASQVFYAKDHSNKGWNVVRKFLPRDSFDDVQKNDNDFEDLHDSIDRKRKRTHSGLE
ncbi:hypothetical protein MTR67_023367 [Solanum verrucosum]|uniref:DUF4216 domain-containing protein n=1 Tax=Solanum verrucosum TaxID=315347 RepID=A0AAF0QTD7_SOLVR|nr:hypothetical protein MTR67_023367 [Solanum verrucosum]